jgi:hypothetical protein
LVTSRGLDGLPADRQEMLEAVWFNMWRLQLRPYRELQPGDTVFFYDPPSGQVRWRRRVSQVLADPYQGVAERSRMVGRRVG